MVTSLAEDQKTKMETQKNQVVERLTKATNILVAVSNNPSVDQLAGAIGLTLLLNKLNKHATAVFSGAVPSTLEFLQPGKTLEKNTDSLRDFIIALDKSKADKLRYKVEDDMVKIFITPYMTSISDKDLEFSQGDFNVELVITLGVNEQQDLDFAITSNGRILHDATVMSISTHAGGSLGSVNWVDESASSLCEMLVSMGVALKADVLDQQMSTALLTGIVAETERFSNEKTSSETMQMSAKLMAAGANQQLVASELEPPEPEPIPLPPPPAHEPESAAEPDHLPTAPEEAEDIELPDIPENAELAEQQPEPPEAPPAPEPEPVAADGTLEISHESEQEDSGEGVEEDQDNKSESKPPAPLEIPVDQIHIDDDGELKPFEEVPISNPKQDTNAPTASRLIVDPPTLSGTLTANSHPEELEPSGDILGVGSNTGTLLKHDTDSSSEDLDAEVSLPPLPGEADSESNATTIPAATHFPPFADPQPEQTLTDLENYVTGGHPAGANVSSDDSSAAEPPVTDLGVAQDAVAQALAGGSPQHLPPVQALNAQPVDINLANVPGASPSLESVIAGNSSAPLTDDFPPLTPITTTPIAQHSDIQDDAEIDTLSANSNAPPPVPPPLMPPSEPTMLYGQQKLPNAEDDNQSQDPMGPI